MDVSGLRNMLDKIKLKKKSQNKFEFREEPTKNDQLMSGKLKSPKIIQLLWLVTKERKYDKRLQ